MSAKTRKDMFGPPAHMAQCEVIEFLRRQVFEDALRAGWLRPSTRSSGSRGKGTVFYSYREVREVSERIAGGMYPEAGTGGIK